MLPGMDGELELDGLLLDFEPFFFELPGVGAVVEALRPSSVALLADGVGVLGVGAGGRVADVCGGIVGAVPGRLGVPGCPGAVGAPVTAGEPGVAGTCAPAAPANARPVLTTAPARSLCICMVSVLPC